MCSSHSFGKDSSMEQVKLKRALGFLLFLFSLDIIFIKAMVKIYLYIYSEWKI